jgi:hypothetical protein
VQRLLSIAPIDSLRSRSIIPPCGPKSAFRVGDAVRDGGWHVVLCRSAIFAGVLVGMRCDIVLRRLSVSSICLSGWRSFDDGNDLSSAGVTRSNRRPFPNRDPTLESPHPRQLPLKPLPFPLEHHHLPPLRRIQALHIKVWDVGCLWWGCWEC